MSSRKTTLGGIGGIKPSGGFSGVMSGIGIGMIAFVISSWMKTTGSFFFSLSKVKRSDSTSGGVATMPGMATTEELNKLRTLSGKELDVYFLQLMLRHHEGGLEMALYAARYGHLAAVRNLAARIVLDQSQEITLMSGLLRSYHAAALPFPVSPALAHSNVGTVLNETPSLRRQNAIQNGWGGA